MSQSSKELAKANRLIDCHVHIVGNGTGNTGCWYRRKPWRFPLEAFMVQHIGLPVSALGGDLDGLYVAKLLEQVRSSSLDAVVILAQEDVYDERGRIIPEVASMYIPNDYVLRLAKKHKEFLPAVSIHPARKDGLEELDRCIAAGAVMMKCLPCCQNIDCTNRAYIPFWEKMAAAGLPLLAHMGGEHTLPVVRRDLTDPRILELPLQIGVKVIAAHSATKSGLFDEQFFFILCDMFRRYPNLYGDISAFNVPIRGSVLPYCFKPGVLERIIHGSDFPVPVLGVWAWLQGFVSWEDFRKWESQPNVLERDYQLKKAMGFPVETFTRINSLLPG